MWNCVQDGGEIMAQRKRHGSYRDTECLCRRTLRFEMPSSRPRGRPKRRFVDVDVGEEDAENMVKYRQVICCGNP